MICDIFFLTDISDFSDRLYMTLASTAALTKAIHFIIYNEEWQLIFKEIKEFRINSIEERTIINDRRRLFQKIVILLFSNANIYGFSMALIAALNGKTMYSGWYPGFDVQNNELDFWIIYGFQGIGTAIIASISLTLDSYYCFMMFMTESQLKIFGHRLSALQMENDYRSVLRIRTELINHIHTHQRIESTFEKIRKNLQAALFFQILLSGIIISLITIELAGVSQT